MNKLFAIWNNETKQFVNVPQALEAGADVDFQPYPELFSDDEGILALIIHEANKHGEWDVVPVTVNITIIKN